MKREVDEGTPIGLALLVIGAVVSIGLLSSSSSIFVRSGTPAAIGASLQGELPAVFASAFVALCFTSILFRSARGFGVGWIVPLTGCVFVVIRALVLAAALSFSDDRRPTGEAAAAHQTANASILVGALLVVTTLLIAPLTAQRHRPRVGRWMTAVYIALVLAIVGFGVGPVAWELTR